MLNLEDLSVSELQAYCDGLKDAIALMPTPRTVTNYANLGINARYLEAQNIIASRLEEMTLKPRRFPG